MPMLILLHHHPPFYIPADYPLHLMLPLPSCLPHQPSLHLFAVARQSGMMMMMMERKGRHRDVSIAIDINGVHDHDYGQHWNTTQLMMLESNRYQVKKSISIS